MKERSKTARNLVIGDIDNLYNQYNGDYEWYIKCAVESKSRTEMKMYEDLALMALEKIEQLQELLEFIEKA